MALPRSRRTYASSPLGQPPFVSMPIMPRRRPATGSRVANRVRLTQSLRSFRKSGSIMKRWLTKQLHKDPRLFRVARGLLFTLRRSLPPVVIEGLPGRIHPNDFMAKRLLPGKVEDYDDYAKHSRTHFEIVSQALQRTGKSWSDVESVIDFGCGYGRVTRWLATAMSPDKVTACDVQAEAVRWCATEFGVRPLVAQPNITDTRFETYEVLFSISVATHLSPRRLKAFFRTLSRIINRGGVVIFSTHGPASARTAGRMKDITDPRKVLSDLDQSGSAFVPYPHYADAELGNTFLTHEYVVQSMAACAPKFVPVAYEEARFWGTQDCYVFKRAPG
jgi:SAM-dependent methyltransferase